MRSIRLISLGFLAAALTGCAAPGGIYKGYEGPPRDDADVTILEWSTHANRKVTHIDGIYLHEEQPFFGGTENTIAHLPPGTHNLRIINNYSNYLTSVRDVTLLPDLEAGRSYRLEVEPCYDCDPFSVDFMVVETATGTVITKSTRQGSESYRDARDREVEECELECERKSSWRYSSCTDPYDEDDDCEDAIDECKDRCDPGISSILNFFD